MAKISENFLEFKGTPNFNRIPLTYTEDQWYINTGKNSIAKVQDSKAIHTWTLQQGHIHYFTTPAAYFKRKLYSVMDDTVLLKWSSEDKSLENTEKVKFQEEIHSVIHAQRAEPLVIFQSGKFIIADDNEFLHPTPVEPMKLKKGEYLEWVDAVISLTTIELFYLAFNKKNKQRTLYCFSVNKEDKAVSSSGNFRVSHENSYFKACCLNHQNLSFFSLWSDGSLQCYRMKDSCSSNVILSLEDVCVDTIADICCIDSKHIVIAKGKPKNEECVVEIWDTEHVLLRGTRKIKSPELFTLQISATSDYIFLNFVSDKLIAIPYILDSSFASTLNTSEPKEIQQLAWNTDLKVKQIPVEDEPMDTNIFNARSLESVEELTKKLLDECSYDLKFISESELIKILKLVLRYRKENQNNLNKDMYNLLNIIFSASFNDVLLIKHLKLLNIVDIMDTLTMLLEYLKHSVNMPMDVMQKPPSDLQVVNWICLIISSHTETLLFTKDKTAKKLLKDLKKTLSVKIHEFEDLEDLQSYLSVCCGKKDILPQQYSVEKYCLESLYV